MLTDPIRIDVKSARATYPVFVGVGAVSGLAGLLRAQGLHHDILFVSSAPVWRTQGKRFRRAVGRVPPLIIPDGERAKTLATVAKIYDALIKRRVDRSGTIVAFGGGVVGDVAGFAAATYLRGIRLVQVPTTLLAQVDSAIGGKVGVNLAAGKNLIGAFHPPAMVVCDPALLASLPRREFRAGLYEIVKYGVIRSRPLFEQLSTSVASIFAHDAAALIPFVAACCRIKAAVVSHDEREVGPRRVLNFGHTIGHALEAITRYQRFRHGEAVAYGMLAAAHVSVARGLLPATDQARVKDLITRLGPLPLVTDLRCADALDAVLHDKKVVDGRLHFVLTRGLGSAVIVSDVHPKELTAAMRSLGMRD